MTPKEKAEEIYNNYDLIIYTDQDHYNQVKQCSLIAVDEIINGNFGDGYNQQFWECVKEEIYNLK